MLPFVALLSFSLFALAALAVDVGLWTARQVELQAAADAAALEGLRSPDDRNAAVEIAAQTTRGAHWDAPHATPALQPNLGNAPHGDLVSGAFSPEGDRAEDARYARGDFVRNEDLDPGTPTSRRGSAFLARLRRVSAAEDPLAVSEGVSSAGAPLPLLFGHGSMLRHRTPDGSPTLRAGVPLRTSAIAEARPAAAVGTAQVLVRDGVELRRIPGRAPIALSRAGWERALAAADGVRLRLEDDGQLHDPLGPVGVVLDAASDAAAADGVAANALGDAVPSGARALPARVDEIVYVPLHDRVDGSDVVIGFGQASLVRVDARSLRLVAEPDAIARENASATLTLGADAVDVGTIRLARQRATSLQGALRAAALAR